MTKELDLVVLKKDLHEHSLKKGDMGTVVHVYADAAAAEVEFMTADGQTVAVVTLEIDDIRPQDDREILHARVV